jgi:hypothetical protein
VSPASSTNVEEGEVVEGCAAGSGTVERKRVTTRWQKETLDDGEGFPEEAVSACARSRLFDTVRATANQVIGSDAAEVERQAANE